MRVLLESRETNEVSVILCGYHANPTLAQETCAIEGRDQLAALRPFRPEPSRIEHEQMNDEHSQTEVGKVDDEYESEVHQQEREPDPRTHLAEDC